MITILNKLKSILAGLMVLSFFMGVSLSSCTGNKKPENKEKVETASESEEHPSGEEHPAGEHPSGDDDEDPSGEEQESDSTKQEHPSN